MKQYIKAKNKTRYDNEVIINIDFIVRIYEICDEYLLMYFGI